jgi:hypothetical protein
LPSVGFSEGKDGLGNPVGFLGAIDGSVPDFSAPPSPIDGFGPVGWGGTGGLTPGPNGFGISGVTFLGVSTPDGFWPDLRLETSSLIVLIEDLYSLTGAGLGDAFDPNGFEEAEGGINGFGLGIPDDGGVNGLGEDGDLGIPLTGGPGGLFGIGGGVKGRGTPTGGDDGCGRGEPIGGMAGLDPRFD